MERLKYCYEIGLSVARVDLWSFWSLARLYVSKRELLTNKKILITSKMVCKAVQNKEVVVLMRSIVHTSVSFLSYIVPIHFGSYSIYKPAKLYTCDAFPIFVISQKANALTKITPYIILGV